MVVTLGGNNDFARMQELSRLIAQFSEHHSVMAVERLDGDEATFDSISQALTSLPFLETKKLVVLREPGANKQFTERAEQLLKGLPESTDLIIIEPKLDKRLSYYKTLKKLTDYHEPVELDAPRLERWLVERATVQKGSLTPSDARLMVSRLGTNQQLLDSELRKLVLHNPKVSKETIELLSERTPQSTIFELLEAAFSGRRQVVLAIYQEQRALKVEPPQVIAMLTWQLHILALLKTAGQRSVEEVAHQAKLNPYVVRKSSAIASRLTLAQLKGLIGKLMQLDIDLKTKSIDADEALQHYLLALG